MALGTAEATPLQVATAYSVFANLGNRVNPISVSRVTNGEGMTVALPVAERRTVLRSDVAYIMDDIMKDVINKGTAAGAQAWGFKNVEGKFAFAGKTGTSRDGWFAGFTPEIVCVVYVGFDDGDDLGLTGADSALPIWADFMRDALAVHPEWNGDWVMPDSIQRAEIDLRDGKLIREITAEEAAAAGTKNDAANSNSNSGTKSKTDKNASANANTPSLPDSMLKTDPFASDVPQEFRRIELFVQGTIPYKTLAEPGADEASNNARETPTPFKTWQEEQDVPQSEKTPAPVSASTPETETKRTVSVMICPISGLRATQYCPKKEAKTFAIGEEPKEFCTFHVTPPN
jgi:membrane peptidoglycan carboxypeptidase